MEKVRPIEILLVEDNPGDVLLTREALKEGRIKNNLHVVTNGEDAISYLFKKDAFKDSISPDLVLLDLNLPKVSGREVLSEIKASEELKHIPFIVLTSSEAEQDILKSYQLHANCYITKPIDMEKFFAVIHNIESFWLTIVKLPGSHHAK